MTDQNKEFYAHRGEACDGVWFKVFPTKAEAIGSVLDYVSRRPASSIQLDTTYVDDFGVTHYVFAVPCGTTAKELADHEEAYNNREMGIVTEEQLQLRSKKDGTRWSLIAGRRSRPEENRFSKKNNGKGGMNKLLNEKYQEYFMGPVTTINEVEIIEEFANYTALVKMDGVKKHVRWSPYLGEIIMKSVRL